jgi:hypothetical protein
MTRRASQCRAEITALAVPAFKKGAVTSSLDRDFDSVRKNAIPIGGDARETAEIVVIVCG